MPGVDRHIEQARSNLAFTRSASFADGGYRDWFVTGLFYTAVHLIDARLADLFGNGGHPRDHAERRDRLDHLLRVSILPQVVHDSYNDLWDLSLKARYSCRPVTQSDVDHAAELLPPIRAWATGADGNVGSESGSQESPALT